jgi:formiminotetrahydrofolate cyclodeaminase
MMDDLDAWLERMAVESLPGGVSAAALAAAMGAALVSKVARISRERRRLAPGPDRQLADLASRAEARRRELSRLVAEDEAAYRQVMGARDLPFDSARRHRAWQAATRSPLATAEACHDLLAGLTGPEEQILARVAVDLAIGRQLLEVGLEAGLRAAEANLQVWGAAPEAAPLRARLDLLRSEERT